MYRKNTNGWLKHIDFIILDMICLQIAFVVAYFIKNGNIHLYNDYLYRNMAIILEAADLMILLIFWYIKGCIKKRTLSRVCKNIKTWFYCLLIGCFIFVYSSKRNFLL